MREFVAGNFIFERASASPIEYLDIIIAFGRREREELEGGEGGGEHEMCPWTPQQGDTGR